YRQRRAAVAILTALLTAFQTLAGAAIASEGIDPSCCADSGVGEKSSIGAQFACKNDSIIDCIMRPYLIESIVFMIGILIAPRMGLRSAHPQFIPYERGVSMPAVTRPANQKGDFLVDFEQKVFEDVKAAPGEKALVTFHSVAFEGSIGLVNLLQVSRLIQKGFDTSVLLYGPGVTLGVLRGFPKLGDDAFPGHQNFNNRIEKIIADD